jgi:cell division septum initiation protein DivIVA
MSGQNVVNIPLLAIFAALTFAPTSAAAAPLRHAGRPPTVLWKSFPLRPHSPTGQIVEVELVTTTTRASTPAGTHEGPQMLWRNFPLRPQSATTNQPQTTPSRENVQSPRHSDSTNRARTWLWFVLGMALTVCVAAAVVVTFFSQVLYEGGLMDRFRLTSKERGARKDEQERREEPAAEEKGDAATRVASYLGSAPDSPPETARPLGSAPDLDRVVGHVGSVLHAAEEAAARIQDEARQDAERVLGEAQKEASARAEAARKHAGITRADAERLRSEAEEWSKQTRDAAENDATDRRVEAEAEARSILSAAERQVAAFGKETERRQQALRTDISLAEDRLRQLVSGLRDVAARLDELLSPSMGGQDEVYLAADQEDALTEALAPSREREEATT